MKRINYGKYTGEDLGIDAEDLMRALADFLLQSGFRSNGYDFQEFDPHSLEELRRAIEEALLNGELFNPDDADRMRQQLEAMSGEDLSQLIEKLINKLYEQGYLSDPEDAQGTAGGAGETRFQVTDKSVDFLGFKTLKDLLGSVGRSNFGAHDTRDLSTGVEASGGAKLYEFGDTLNLDAGAT